MDPNETTNKNDNKTDNKVDKPITPLNKNAIEFVPKKIKNKETSEQSEKESSININSNNNNKIFENDKNNNEYNEFLNCVNERVNNNGKVEYPYYQNYNKFDQNMNFDEENKDQEEQNPQNEDDEDDVDKLEDEFLEEMIDPNQFDDDEDESDDEKWFPKFMNCECCKGFVYKCQGETCQTLGKCFCKLKAQMDGDNDD
jgi:hypothetical protein